MCHNGHLKTMIYMHTSPDRFLDRKELRRYLHRPPETAVVFMLGKSKNKSLAHLVFQEAEQFEDMVIFDAFVDSYRNLTPKSVHSIRWIQNECGANPTLRNIVKLDDDVWVNFPMLKSYLHLEIPKRPYRIHCLVWRRVRVARRPRSKWFVSKVEYSLPYNPPYCGGLAYILPKQLLTVLVNASYKVPFFWVDDIYVTGLLAREAHLDHAQIRTYYAFQVNQNINLTADWEETIMNAFGATKIMFSHMDTPFLRSLRSFLFQRINETLLNYTQFTVF
ncbi:beta-1,3-galactosyltransferase 5-like isoform X1 [Varroa jacobsoni]|uniref:beta-1,3-galactosyltransferase 5-like isoform X1 n=2 Tax=Varroa jacobsoni TaxID=62625 RepID=UPI000BF49B36|nr:beta-1,3-galactosyltransferase 5-like isoform X1 [Varroa jacobsoni]